MAKKKKTVLGRKRDPEVENKVLEAALNALADVGFDAMTMDMVAARAQSAKTTVYRRWPSKAELVRDSLIYMGRNSVDVASMPNTGSLRGDLLAVNKPHSAEHSERKVRVLSKLGSFHSDHPKLASEMMAEIFGPMSAMNKSIMQAAIERKEIAKSANIDLACEVIVAMIIYRTSSELKPFNREYYARLLDQILLPALKA